MRTLSCFTCFARQSVKRRNHRHLARGLCQLHQRRADDAVYISEAAGDEEADGFDGYWEGQGEGEGGEVEGFHEFELEWRCEWCVAFYMLSLLYL